MRSRQPRVVLPTGELRHLGGLRLTGDEASREVRFNDEATVAGRLFGAAGAWVGLSFICFLASTGRMPWASFVTTSLEPTISGTQAWLQQGPDVGRAMVGARSAVAREPRRAVVQKPEPPQSTSPGTRAPEAASPEVALHSETQMHVPGLPRVPSPRIDFGRWSSAGNKRGSEPSVGAKALALIDASRTDGAWLEAPNATAQAAVAAEKPRNAAVMDKGTSESGAKLSRLQSRVPAPASMVDRSVALGGAPGALGAVASKFPAVPLDGAWGDVATSARHDNRQESASEPAPPPSSIRVSSGKSCEAAYAASVRDISMAKTSTPDVAPREYASLLEREPFASCGVERAARIEICVAVQQGKAVGVTVSTTPADSGLARCVATRVRGLQFPKSAELDLVRTTLTFSSR